MTRPMSMTRDKGGVEQLGVRSALLIAKYECHIWVGPYMGSSIYIKIEFSLKLQKKARRRGA